MNYVTALLAAGLICAALPAEAGICSNEIAMISKMLSGGGMGGAAPAVPSTGSAGTLGAVTGSGAATGALGGAMGGAAANPATVAQASQAVDQAKLADAAGNETSCMDYINQAKQLLGLIK